jgi:FMN phosphatase YigB (HAD superfamily)
VALRGLLVDVGGTLVDDRTWIPADRDRAARLRRMADALGGTQPWFEAFVDHAFEEGAATPHEQRTAEAVTAFLVDHGLTPTEDQVETICRANAVPLRESVQLEAHALESMQRARGMGLRMAICSNTLWRGDDDARRDMADLGFDGIFDAVVTSRSTGYEKPHPAIFERCLAELEVGPSEAAMVGDLLDRDVGGARSVGMRAIWKRPVGFADPVDPVPDAEIGSLLDLIPILDAWVDEGLD